MDAIPAIRSQSGIGYSRILGRYSSLASLAVFALLSAFFCTAAAEDRIDFNQQIRPILSDKCFACHGPDQNSEVSQETDLRLDLRSSAVENEAIVPNDSAASELIARVVASDISLLMPPPESHKPRLTKEEVEVLRRWIEQGADYEKLWSLTAPKRPKIPDLELQLWARNPIDAFVLSALEEKGMQPSPRANRRMLIRRVAFDLTGLPPSPDEVEAFVADPAPTQQALETVVDRLLDSTAYGEHLASEWTQLARYADTNGYQNDFKRQMWIWRDWVIGAFNDNMPYDQFVLEQMAGDLLPSPTQSQLIATGFHRNNRTVTEAGSIDEEWRVENNIDRVETTGTVFLGLTMGCARCHDHKYDAITQREFYEFYAFFNSIDEKGVYNEKRGNVAPLIEVPSEEHFERIAELEAKVEEASQRATEIVDARIDEMGQRLRESLEQPVDTFPIWSLPLDGSIEIVASDNFRDHSLVAKYPGRNVKWEDGIVGGALRLGGTGKSHVSIAGKTNIDTNTAFSFAMWIRPKRGAGTLVSQMHDEAYYRGWDSILLNDRRLKVHVVHHWSDNAIGAITKLPLPEDQWIHVAVSYDGTGKAAGVRVFLNGRESELEIERDSLTGSIAVDQPMRIGRRSTGAFFHGDVSAFHFFDHPIGPPAVERTMAHDLSSRVGLDFDQWSDARRKQLRSFVMEDLFFASDQYGIGLASLREELKKTIASTPSVMVLKDRETPRETYVLNRGMYDSPDKSEVLAPNVPRVLPPLPEGAPLNRLTLANWLVDPKHPTLARVQVNRIWQRLFGVGIVSTPDNFGVQGDAPSHPKLLDWLAAEFIDSGWDMKALHKQIVLSATYQQTSDVPRSDYTQDPKNRMLARGARFRLPAESVRDNALSVAGLLANKVGGPSVRPYQPPGLWDELAGGASEGSYKKSQGDDIYRRSLYTNRKRTVPHPTLSTFDAPSFEICQAKRATTNTPLQALALLNDLTYVEAARGLALRMLAKAAASPEGRIEYGFLLATSRVPTPAERTTLLAALQQHLEHYRDNDGDARALVAHGELPLNESVDVSELAAYSVVASVILNLDETITRQ